MKRLHALWVQKYPASTHSEQQLRDQAAYIIKRDGPPQAAAMQPAGAPISPPMPPPADNSLPVETPSPRSRRRCLAPRAANINLQPQEGVDKSQAIKEDFEVYLRISLERRGQGFAARKNINKPVHKYRAVDIAAVNEVLSNFFSGEVSLEDLNYAAYAAAAFLSGKQRRGGEAPVDKIKRQLRDLDDKILQRRRSASHIQSVIDMMKSGKAPTKKIKALMCTFRKKYKCLRLAVLLTARQKEADTIRAHKVAREKLISRLKWVQDNIIFENNSRQFLSRNERTTPLENPPTVEALENFWVEQCEMEAPFDPGSPALRTFRRLCEQLIPERSECPEITADWVARALKGKRNWAAPGVDKIHAFWWKKLTALHGPLAAQYNAMLKGEVAPPNWFVEGRTILIPKKGDLSLPKNHRPITCLNTQYKCFTSILNDIINTGVKPVWDMFIEQKGSRRGHEGCKEHILVDRMITVDAARHKRNLSVAWLDYRNAYGMTSHQLLLCICDMLNLPVQLCRCLEELMLLWRTRLTLWAGARPVRTRYITFERGVFQGDSMSSTLFCLSLLPLSCALRDVDGYRAGPPGERDSKFTHLLFMDDLKLYAKSPEELSEALEIVHKYSSDIGMDFGLDKCAVLNIRAGVADDVGDDVTLADGSVIHHLEAGERYKYLGVSERHHHDAVKVKEAMLGVYADRLNNIWASSLSAKNKVQATNSLAVSVLLYSFGAIKWKVDELKQVDRDTRKTMRVYRSLHPNSSVQRIYLPRNMGGRGLLSLERMHDRMVIAMASRVAVSTDPLLQSVRVHEEYGVGAFLFKAARRAAGNLGLCLVFPEDSSSEEEVDGDNILEMAPSTQKKAVRKAEVDMLQKEHLDKAMHSLYYKLLDSAGLDKERSFAFLKSSGLKSETEGFIMAVQDGVFNTLVYRRRIFNLDIDTRCRACHQKPETTMHLLSACPVYARTLYIYRHNSALRVLYFYLRHKFRIDQDPVLPYAPGDIETVVENERCRIYWNYAFPTTRLLEATKPDIVVLDKEAKEIYVIEFSAPAENNIVLKVAEKTEKYRDLLVELRQMHRGFRVRLAVIVIGCLGGVPGSVVKALEGIPFCRDNATWLADAMQKAVILGSLHLLRAHGEVD
jgi:hypothetical protein